jgi:hypothetical protein
MIALVSHGPPLPIIPPGVSPRRFHAPGVTISQNLVPVKQFGIIRAPEPQKAANHLYSSHQSVE